MLVTSSGQQVHAPRPQLTCHSAARCWPHAFPQEPGTTFVAAACGTAHSVLLTSCGQVYAAGCNAQGACGLPPDTDTVSAPAWLPGHERLWCYMSQVQ